MDLSPAWLLATFIGGFFLNGTPCVFPMLSVTVALFGDRKKRSVREAFPKAFIYFLGITVTYSALGTAAALSGEFFGVAFQNTWFLLVLAILMFVLALSMFGVYEFQMPSSILNWAGGKRRAGLLGIFLSGIFVGVIAAPCIGPAVVALMVIVGQMADPLKGFVIFFVFSVGLGLPYLLFGMFSGLLNKLPKSGDWLLWVKRLFGVALLGLAFLYFVSGFYEGLVPHVFPLTILAGAVYLGFVDGSGNKSARFTWFKRIAGTLAITSVALSFWLRPTQQVQWEMYAVEKLELARQEGKPVIVDIYADWCIPCHELDRYTYTNQRVIEALEPFVRLKVDATNPKSPEALAPIERFEAVGVPTILFLDSQGNEVADTRIIGYVPPEVFLESVERVPLSKSE
jgi:thioredoxin:protein disulfide reductase